MTAGCEGAQVFVWHRNAWRHTKKPAWFPFRYYTVVLMFCTQGGPSVQPVLRTAAQDRQRLSKQVAEIRNHLITVQVKANESIDLLNKCYGS